MQRKNSGLIGFIVLLILLLVSGAIVFLVKYEAKAYEIFNRYISDELIEKILSLFSLNS